MFEQDCKPKLWGITTIGERGQLVVPSKLREEMGVAGGDQFMVVTKGKFIGLIREEDMTDLLRGWLDDMDESESCEEC